MENAVVRDCWKQGFVTVKRLDDVDNVGAYLTAYLGDMELSEASKADMAVSYSKGIKEVEYPYLEQETLQHSPDPAHGFRDA